MITVHFEKTARTLPITRKTTAVDFMQLLIRKLMHERNVSSNTDSLSALQMQLASHWLFEIVATSDSPERRSPSPGGSSSSSSSTLSTDTRRRRFRTLLGRRDSDSSSNFDDGNYRLVHPCRKLWDNLGSVELYCKPVTHNEHRNLRIGIRQYLQQYPATTLSIPMVELMREVLSTERRIALDELGTCMIEQFEELKRVARLPPPVATPRPQDASDDYSFESPSVSPTSPSSIATSAVVTLADQPPAIDEDQLSSVLQLLTECVEYEIAIRQQQQQQQQQLQQQQQPPPAASTEEHRGFTWRIQNGRLVRRSCSEASLREAYAQALLPMLSSRRNTASSIDESGVIAWSDDDEDDDSDDSSSASRSASPSTEDTL